MSQAPDPDGTPLKLFAEAQPPTKPAASTAKNASNDPKKRAQLEATVRAKVSCDKAAYDVQWLLLEPAVPEAALDAAAEVLQPEHYEDIVVERALDGLCGFPCCGEVAPARGQGRKIHVSLSDKKVYDISGLHNFCGRACAQRSQAYLQRLQPVSLFLRTGDPTAAAAAVAATRAATTTATDAPSGSTAAAAAPAVDVSDSTAAATHAAAPVPPPPPPPPGAKGPSAAAAASASKAFGAGATLGGVLERPQAKPNTTFAQPASLGMVEGYAARLEREAMAARKASSSSSSKSSKAAPPRGPVLLDYGS